MTHARLYKSRRLYKVSILKLSLFEIEPSWNTRIFTSSESVHKVKSDPVVKYKISPALFALRTTLLLFGVNDDKFNRLYLKKLPIERVDPQNSSYFCGKLNNGSKNMEYESSVNFVDQG